MYNKYALPSDINCAIQHEQASMFGEPDKNSKTCVCCKQPIQKVQYGLSQDLVKIFQQKNIEIAIPLYFYIVKILIISLVVVFFLNSLYLFFKSQQACIQLNKVDINNCQEFLFFYIISEKFLYNQLNKKEKEEYLILGFSTYIVLLIFPYLNKFIINKIHNIKMKNQQQMQKQNLCHIFIKYCPQNYKIEDLKKYLNQIIATEIPFDFKIRILDVFEVDDYSEYAVTYQNYKNKIFSLKKFQPNSHIKIDYKDKNKKEKKIKQKLAELKVLREEMIFYQKVGIPKTQKFIVQFQDENQAKVMYYKILQKQEKCCVATCKNLKICFKPNLIKEKHISVFKLPEIDDIAWKNMGVHSKVKKKARCKQYFISFLIYLIINLLIFGILFIQYYFDNFEVFIKDQKIKNRELIQIGTSFGFFLFGQIMHFSIKRQTRKFYTGQYSGQQTQFFLLHYFFFTIYYILVPTQFFFLLNFINQEQKIVDGINKQIQTNFVVFCFMKAVLQVFNLEILKNKLSKWYFQRNDKYKQKYQEKLQKIFQKPKFVLENNVLIVYQIWSLVVYAAYESPVLVFAQILFLGIIYWADLYNLLRNNRVKPYSFSLLEKITSSSLFSYLNFINCLIFLEIRISIIQFYGLTYEAIFNASNMMNLISLTFFITTLIPTIIMIIQIFWVVRKLVFSILKFTFNILFCIFFCRKKVNFQKVLDEILKKNKDNIEQQKIWSLDIQQNQENYFKSYEKFTEKFTPELFDAIYQEVVGQYENLNNSFNHEIQLTFSHQNSADNNVQENKNNEENNELGQNLIKDDDNSIIDLKNYNNNLDQMEKYQEINLAQQLEKKDNELFQQLRQKSNQFIKTPTYKKQN